MSGSIPLEESFFQNNHSILQESHLKIESWRAAKGERLEGARGHYEDAVVSKAISGREGSLEWGDKAPQMAYTKATSLFS